MEEAAAAGGGCAVGGMAGLLTAGAVGLILDRAEAAIPVNDTFLLLLALASHLRSYALPSSTSMALSGAASLRAPPGLAIGVTPAHMPSSSTTSSSSSSSSSSSAPGSDTPSSSLATGWVRLTRLVLADLFPAPTAALTTQDAGLLDSGAMSKIGDGNTGFEHGSLSPSEAKRPAARCSNPEGNPAVSPPCPVAAARSDFPSAPCCAVRAPVERAPSPAPPIQDIWRGRSPQCRGVALVTKRERNSHRNRKA